MVCLLHQTFSLISSHPATAPSRCQRLLTGFIFINHVSDAYPPQSPNTVYRTLELDRFRSFQRLQFFIIPISSGTTANLSSGCSQSDEHLLNPSAEARYFQHPLSSSGLAPAPGLGNSHRTSAHTWLAPLLPLQHKDYRSINIR